jgi:hypothetical protein
MKEHGLATVPVPDDALAEWRKCAEDIYPRLRGPFVPKDVFDEAVALARRARQTN